MAAAVQAYVTAYGTPPTTAASASAPASGPSETPAADPLATASAELDSALAAARAALRNGCTQPDFVSQLNGALSGIQADGAVPSAVLRRLTANLTGTVGTDTTVEVELGDDLSKVVATAAPGATLYLAKGEYRLKDTLVLLDGITLAGRGRQQTRLLSDAAGVSVLVMAASLVGLRDLTVRRNPKAPGTVVTAGSSTTLALEQVRLSGARTDANRQGGAGLDLAGTAGAASPGRTTVEVTDSEFLDNTWAGISVSAGHRVSVATSTFRDNGECGACFLGTAEGSIERSTFSDNGVGVAVVGSSAAVIRGNRFTGGQVGVQVGNTATPTIDGNRISSAKRAAVIFTDTAAGVVRKTRCVKVDVGIVLSAKALPSLMDNACTLARASK
ncbi:MAG: right-handed parallel beta-helix repeat-containing protein [Propionicimonas sp.]